MNKNNGKCLNCGIDVTGRSLTCSPKCRKAVSRAKKSVTQTVTTVTESVTLKPISVTENVTVPKSVTPKKVVINDPKKLVEKAKAIKAKTGGMEENLVPLHREMNDFYKSKITWGGVTKKGIITYELPDGSKEHFRIR